MDEKIILNSALPDERPQVLKDKDYSTQEIASAATIVPFENPKVINLTATIYNQWYVGSCVPHGFLTQLEYEGIVPHFPDGMSQVSAYRKRENYPSAGSNGVDMYEKIRSGLTLNSEVPTITGMTEDEATAMQYIEGAKLISDFKYFQYIDKVTGQSLLHDVPMDVAIGKAVSIFIYATTQEWAEEYVEIKTPDLQLKNAEVRHCICIIPKGDFTENGKQWLSVHDSAKFANRHLRYLSSDFFKKRCYFAAKVSKVGIPPPPLPPQLIDKPIIPCQYGQKSSDVLNLQVFLVKEGKLSSEYMTGYYGALTASAVLWWQLEHWDKFTDNVPTLLKYGGKYWGKQSIAIIS